MNDSDNKGIEELRAELGELKEQNSSLNERVIELYALYNVSRTLSMSLQLGELFELTMNAIGEALNLDQFCLMLIDEDTDELVIQASHGMPGQVGKTGVVCARKGMSSKVARGGKPVMIADVAGEGEFFYFEGSHIGKGSYLGVPLKRKDGSVLGVLNAHKPEGESFGDAELRLFEAVASHVSVAIDNALTFKQTRELSHRDDLTDLYNRRYFFERFDREVYRDDRYYHDISLLMLDIDNFKRLNDSHGHLQGDEVLKKLAKIIEDKVRKADVVARYGGEEFLVLLPETDREGAICVAEKLRARIEKNEFGNGGPDDPSIHITVTVGVAAYPEDALEAGSLLDRVDKALYYGKALGRNQVCADTPDGKEEPAPQ